MKNLSLSFLLTLLIAVPVMAQKSGKGDEEQAIKKGEVPHPILAAFEKSYPKAKVKGYSKEMDKGKAVYEIESTEGKMLRDVTYDEGANLVSVEESLPFAKLPQAVKAAVKKEFPKSKAIRCEKIQKGATTEFEVVMKSGKKQQEIVFDGDGKVVETEQVGEKEEKE